MWPSTEKNRLKTEKLLRQSTYYLPTNIETFVYRIFSIDSKRNFLKEKVDTNTNVEIQRCLSKLSY